MGIETWLAPDQATGAEVALKTALPDAQERSLLEAQIPETEPAPGNVHASLEKERWWTTQASVKRSGRS